MTLILQTNVAGILHVWLARGPKDIQAFEQTVEWHGSDQALTFLDRALEQQKKRLVDIRKIIVVRGPGGFTAVRTGLIIANTLSAEFHIPVVGVVSKQLLTMKRIILLLSNRGQKKLVRPYYGKAPNITKPKLQRGR